MWQETLLSVQNHGGIPVLGPVLVAKVGSQLVQEAATVVVWARRGILKRA